tara:strand:- start:114 stop:467 length:354 start_codon:yes stop_codon:yes gene_type:complete
MIYIPIIQEAIDEVKASAELKGCDVLVVPAFPSSGIHTSCIMQLEGSDTFGIIGVNVEGHSTDDEPMCYFTFNGKLYDYCKAEGFTRDQMVEDISFENKILIRQTRENFADCILGIS